MTRIDSGGPYSLSRGVFAVVDGLVDLCDCCAVEGVQAGSGGSSHSPLPEPVLSYDYSEQQEQQ